MTCDTHNGAISTQDYAMLSQLAYRDLEEGQTFGGYEVITISTPNTSSYYGVLFQNVDTKEYVIANRGSADFIDFAVIDLQMALTNINEQYADVYSCIQN